MTLPSKGHHYKCNPLTPARLLGKRGSSLKGLRDAACWASLQSHAQLGVCSSSALCSTTMNFPSFTPSRLFPRRTRSPPPSAELTFSSFGVQVKCHFHRKHFLTSDQVQCPGYILLQHHILPWKCFYIFLFDYLTHLCLFHRMLSSRRTGTL